MAVSVPNEVTSDRKIIASSLEKEKEKENPTFRKFLTDRKYKTVQQQPYNSLSPGVESR